MLKRIMGWLESWRLRRLAKIKSDIFAKRRIIVQNKMGLQSRKHTSLEWHVTLRANYELLEEIRGLLWERWWLERRHFA